MADGPDTKTDTASGETGSSPQSDPGTASEGEKETSFTQAEFDKEVSDRLTSAGRDEAALTERANALKADIAAFDQRQVAARKADEDREEARVRETGDEGSIAAFAEGRSQRESKTALDRQRVDQEATAASLTEREQRQSAFDRDRLVEKIATETGVVDINRLSRFGGVTEEEIRELAEVLPKKEQPANGAEGTPPAPDSGRGSGGVAVTQENADTLWMEGKITDEQYRPYMPQSGRRR